MTVRTLLYLGYVLDRDFVAHSDGVQWFIPNQPTPAEIAAAEPLAQAAYEAAKAERIAAAADIADIKAQFATDRDKLQAIIAAPGGTNANRDAQILDMAQIMRRLLKAAKAQAL